MPKKILSEFWLVLSALILSFAWLLPNHFPPWLSFHGDAWASSVLMVLGVWVGLRSSSQGGWHVLSLLTAFLCVVPWLQFAGGLIPSFGTAWMSSIYLLGLLIAIQTGIQWEHYSQGQVGDFIFLAVLIAAVASVGLQFHQWFGLDPVGPWTLHATNQTRLYANMAQPNQLASLLLLGLLACSWWFYRGKINAFTVLLIASFILVGVALTGSRTAWLNIIFLFVAATFMRSKLPSKSYYFAIMGLCGFFVICVLLLPFITNSLNTEADMEYRSLADPARIFAWKMFIHASYQQPFFGFGWGPLAGASFLVVEQYPGQPGLFLQAHNLILDIILWNGYPLGLLIVSIILWWVWRACTLMRTFGQLHLLAFLVVLGTHAMLEYPLQYAIFLLPFGLVVGVLHVDLGMEVVCEGRPWQWASLLLIAALALFVTIKDYFRVENSFYGLRFESKKIKTDIPSAPPEVFALTQFRDHLLLARNIPQSGLSTSDLRWMTDTVNTLPSYLVMYKLAANLALNGRAEDARHWQIRICKTMAAGNCSNMRETWKKDAANNPAMGVFALSEDDIR